MRKLGQHLLMLLFALSLASGCTTQRRTVTTETVTKEPGETAVIERRAETRTETEAEEKPPNAASGTLNALGEIIALPFRLVGGFIRMLF